MVHLTLVDLSEDRTRLLLVDDQGREFTLDLDAKLRAAIRGDDSRLGTLEIHMDSALRPRDIQQRIRAGETPEAVAAAAQTTVDKIMPFAGPVLAERAHIAERAQKASVRRVSDSGSTGAARTLGDAVAAQLRAAGLPYGCVEWDSARREDGRWTLIGRWSGGKRKGEATYSFDHRGNFVVADNDDGHWLVGDLVEAPTPAAKPKAGERRLSAVPNEQLPLGDDAIELANEPASRAPADVEAADAPEDRPDDRPKDDAPADNAPADNAPAASVVEPMGEPVPRRPRPRRRRSSREEPGFFDAVFARAEVGEPAPPEPTTKSQAEAVPAAETAPAAADEQLPDDAPTTEHTAITDHDPAEGEPVTRTPRKRGSRASVPSWDEIMFGGGPKE